MEINRGDREEEIRGCSQWRSEGNWRPGAKLNFAPPFKKNLYNDIEMYIVFN